ncbi:hypothetical protein BACCAP_01523 [Pseudoflavonifractor capillosus ATCC 29799]|uniref:Uncharacterized protein n=1 Tax=Pseudoflavonifractor capillosus ATCC 29799 TaxID=411467 RepID=A6NTJ5_9FIRM|nr:hypothetical protein BACCAP_01523 [Pseudoflavonifractor capillosus ATCC 29799]
MMNCTPVTSRGFARDYREGRLSFRHLTSTLGQVLREMRRIYKLFISAPQINATLYLSFHRR